MTKSWCTRIIAVTVVFNCAGGPVAWAQMNQAPGKQQMQAVAPPALTRIVPTSYGYDLIGTGFGLDKNKVQIFEGATQLTGSAVVSLAGDKIAVQSKPSGSVQHKVVVAGQSSGLSFTHPVSGQAVGMQSELKQNASIAQPLGGARDSGSAAISDVNLKQNIDLKGLAGQSQGQSDLKQGGLQSGMQGQLGGKAALLGESGGVQSSGDKLKESLGKQGPITGSNADTFGGGRINAKNQGGTGNFAGTGKGKTSSGELDDKAMGGAKGSPEETRYEQQAGDVHYKATENMSQSDRQTYWAKEEKSQREGSDPAPKGGAAGRPRDDTLGTGSGPMTRQDVNFQRRALDARTNATGKGDDRGDQQPTGGGDGRMIERNKADGPDREKGTSTVNMDKALEINKVVNPVRQ